MEIKPETAQLVQEEIRSGRIHSIDELIVFAVHLLREKRSAEQPTAQTPGAEIDLDQSVSL